MSAVNSNLQSVNSTDILFTNIITLQLLKPGRNNIFCEKSIWKRIPLYQKFII